MKFFIQTVVFICVCFTALISFSTQADTQPLHQGSIQQAFSSWGSKSVSGDWKIVEDNGSYFVELSDNFKAKSGPDVKVFLSPASAQSVSGDNATAGSLFLHQLEEFSGKTRIAIPKGTDLSQYQSLVFHCEAFSKLWGTSPLQ